MRVTRKPIQRAVPREIATALLLIKNSHSLETLEPVNAWRILPIEMLYLAHGIGGNNTQSPEIPQLLAIGLYLIKRESLVKARPITIADLSSQSNRGSVLRLYVLRRLILQMMVEKAGRMVELYISGLLEAGGTELLEKVTAAVDIIEKTNEQPIPAFYRAGLPNSTEINKIFREDFHQLLSEHELGTPHIRTIDPGIETGYFEAAEAYCCAKRSIESRIKGAIKLAQIGGFEEDFVDEVF